MPTPVFRRVLAPTSWGAWLLLALGVWTALSLAAPRGAALAELAASSRDSSPIQWLPHAAGDSMGELAVAQGFAPLKQGKTQPLWCSFSSPGALAASVPPLSSTALVGHTTQPHADLHLPAARGPIFFAMPPPAGRLG